MKSHYNLTNSEFLDQFIQCKLDPAEFSHEAHLRLAWIHIQRHGIESALENIQNQLKAYVAFVGAKDKYNTTLTIAAIKAVDHFIRRSKSNNFEDFLEEFPRLKTNFRDLMKSHYSFDIYNSHQAKTEYLEPDLQPFE
ncbi:MAG: hypothetical protein AAGA77_05690 [Bacteroidota bacterium]